MAKVSPKYVLEAYLSWKGRIGRGEFWAYGVALNIVWMLVATMLALQASLIGELASLVWYFVLLAFYSGLLVKRGHDRGRPAAFSFGLLVARMTLFLIGGVTGNPAFSLIGAAIVLYVVVDYAFMPGQKHENRYGPAPDGQGLTKNPLVLGAEPPAGPTLSSEPPKA